MNPHEQPHLALGKAGQEPHLPQRARWVETLPQELLDGGEHLSFPGRRLEWQLPHVAGQIERRGIDPQRSAEAPPRNVDELSETRDEMQPAMDCIANRFDAEPTVLVQQRTAVEDGKGADVLRPPPARP